MLKRFSALALLLIFLPSCLIYSTGKFYTDDLLVEPEGIKGKWQLAMDVGDDLSPKQSIHWEFTEGQLITVDQRGRSSNFAVHFFKIGDTLLLDATPGDPDKENGPNKYWAISVLPMHLLFKVEREGKKISLLPLSYQWFEKKGKKFTKDIPSISVENKEDQRIYDNKPEAWVDFLKRHLKDKELFDRESRFILKKK